LASEAPPCGENASGTEFSETQRPNLNGRKKIANAAAVIARAPPVFGPQMLGDSEACRYCRGVDETHDEILLLCSDKSRGAAAYSNDEMITIPP